MSQTETINSLFITAYQPFQHFLLARFDTMCGTNGCACGPVGDALGPTAVSSGNLVFGDQVESGDPATCPTGGTVLTGGTVWSGYRNPALVSGAPAASLLAATTNVVAELPATINGQPPPTAVLVGLNSGPLSTSIDPLGTVQQIGISKAGLGIEVDTTGVHTLRVYDPSTGMLIHQVSVQPTAEMAAMSGFRILYTNGNQLRVLNLITWHTHQVSNIPALNTYTVLLDGRQIVLHSPRHPTQIYGITLPRLP